MSVEGRAHSIGLTYEANTSLSGSLALRGPEVVRLDRLAGSGGPMPVSTKGASLNT